MPFSNFSRTSNLQESNASWFERAAQVIPGGVNSPVRAFRAVGGNPPFIVRGNGSRIWDEDGNEYLDYVCSWGALFLGHANPYVIKAVRDAAAHGLTFGAATSREVLLAEQIQQAIPSLEKIRLVSSGTEATMTAIRLARAYTKRNKILKFEGCYHGHADPFLVQAGSGLLTFGNPSSPGIPEATVRETLVLPYNDLEALEQAFSKHGKELACIIVEPVAGNMGVVKPRSGFLEKLKDLCEKYGALLLFDEVITGFRFHFGGYQNLCIAISSKSLTNRSLADSQASLQSDSLIHSNIQPDLTTLGKIIGGGLPLAALGGRNEIMNLLAPLGPVYQAGTLSGNPLATAAGLATLEILKEKKIYEENEKKSFNLAEGIQKLARQKGLAVTVNQAGSMFSFFFAKGPVETLNQVMSCNQEFYKRFFHAMREKGIYLPPSPFEAWFLSAAHTDHDIEQTLSAVEEAFSAGL